MAERLDLGSTTPYRRGDTVALGVTFADENAVPIDMTGRAVWLTIKLSSADTDAAAAFQVVETPVDGSLGLVNLIIPASATKLFLPTSYQYDIQIVDTAAPEDIVQTYLYGKIKFAADITLGQ